MSRTEAILHLLEDGPATGTGVREAIAATDGARLAEAAVEAPALSAAAPS